MAIGRAEHLTATSTTSLTCLLPVCINLLRTSLPGELRLAPHAPSPGWLMFLLLLPFSCSSSYSIIAGATQGALCKALLRPANYVATHRSHPGLPYTVGQVALTHCQCVCDCCRCHSGGIGKALLGPANYVVTPRSHSGLPYTVG